ncbi:hypothetical protein GGR58DRAFT_519816 [Xylaria digitata]|nr:hypothetical protein GGR58DRAFT_519816 [Xylaria digitata]
MVQYSPLDISRKRIRVIRLLPGALPNANTTPSAIEYTLEHVSLDDYSSQYRTFLELEKTPKSPTQRAFLWDLATSQTALIEQFRKIAPPGDASDAIAVFSENPVYQRGSFRNATTYSWGDFFALSYEWADPSDTDEIIVNGERTTITKSLRHALQRLSTCRRMRQIYPTALKVLIMTGPDVEHPDALGQLLNKVWDSTLKGDDDFSMDIDMFLSEENYSAWKSVFELAGRSYWRRLWVIQEVYLANTGAWLCYGDRFCPVSTFFGAVNLVYSHFHRVRTVLAHASGGQSENWILNIENLESFLHHQNTKQQEVTYPNLLALLDMGRKAKQFDPRDKVYGLLGMMEDKFQVEPDYRLPLSEVYRNFVEHVIKTTGSLSIIYQRASNPLEEPLAATAYLDTWAAGGSLHNYRLPDIPGHLHCEGFMIDTIDQLACTGTYITDHSAHDTVWWPQSQEARSTYKDSAVVRQAFWNSVTLSRSVVKGETAMPYLLNIPYVDGRCTRNSYLNVIDRFQQCNRNLVVAGQPLFSHFPAWSESYYKLPDHTEILNTPSHLVIPIVYRRFMVTEKGCMGTAPRAAELDDSIFILKGCNAPLILRPAENGTYSVLGECYVDGVMHGEAMSDLEKGRYQTRTIIIR